MGIRKWSISSLEYGQRILSSGLEGARSGQEAFLRGRSFTPFLSESVHKAWKPCMVGACIGLLGSISGSRHKSISRVLRCGFMGGAIGMGFGIAWNGRGLTESITSNALRNIAKVRDENWLESHPIDYA